MAGEKIRPRILRRLTELLEMPKDVFLDLPKATIFGSLQVMIENHQGVLEYTPERVRVRTGEGEIQITGIRLKIGVIVRNELVVDGKIQSVSFVGGKGRS